MSIYLSKRRSQNGQKKGAFACIFKTKRQKHRPGLANSRFVCFFWLLSFFLSESCCAPPHKSTRSINLMKYKIYLLGNASEMQLNWNGSLNDVSTSRTSFGFYIIVRSMYHNDFGSHQCQEKKVPLFISNGFKYLPPWIRVEMIYLVIRQQHTAFDRFSCIQRNE